MGRSHPVRDDLDGLAAFRLTTKVTESLSGSTPAAFAQDGSYLTAELTGGFRHPGKANSAEAEKVVAPAAEFGASAIALQLDVGSAGTSDGFAENLRDALAGMDADRRDDLVNNAGTSSSADLRRSRMRKSTRSTPFISMALF